MSTMTAQPETLANSADARRAMIDSQLRTSGVNEEFVLARMLAVPREDYLPDEKKALAYIDRSIALGADAHLCSPLFYGKLLIEADPRADDSVLIIEGGTGYLADLVRPLVGEVDTISVADAADPAKAPAKTYSLVLVDGAIEELPPHLANSLAEGGRIVGGLLLRKVTRLASGRKVAGTVSLLPVEDLGIPVLHAFDKPKGWTF
ncbi:protein-L-isoaspartate O-methyltransferase [Erythrobacter sp. THAF29]|uniref:protein-L-isoaspartate O-methyltransferase family protein n=1 Tax=Erythrobacter sp. THAF29 TaxID=2587851 RepID=UPI0012AAB2C0|nr:protein-L-isoaspartate O-methyltransferase [Erythrobacter sp. THAF29]QFT76391.1 protein-L-isoaspartate O-methyltransferase [Erythrobacter sp. THAF29]